MDVGLDHAQLVISGDGLQGSLEVVRRLAVAYCPICTPPMLIDTGDSDQDNGNVLGAIFLPDLKGTI